MIHNLPVMAHMERLSAALEKEKGQSWGLAQGLCPEVSGGLLIVMPREQAAAYCKDMERLEVWSLCLDIPISWVSSNVSIDMKCWTTKMI